MCGRGACVAGRCAWWGACMTGGLHGRETCVEGGGMHGRGSMCGGWCAWQGALHGMHVGGGCAWQEKQLKWAVGILLECILVETEFV